MQNIPKFILLICISLLVAGCKLAVIVLEGGEVRSDSSGTCIAGTICIVEVSDTSFSNGIDLNGWTWASVADVNRLFNHYIGSDELGPGPDELYDSSDSTWGAAFYSDGWIATGELVFPESRGILGWLRNRKNPELAYAARISDSIPGAWYPAPGDWDTPDPFDLVSTANVDPVDERRDHGGWFYRLP